jgi:hypothetical protein
MYPKSNECYVDAHDLTTAGTTVGFVSTSVCLKPHTPVASTRGPGAVLDIYVTVYIDYM